MPPKKANKTGASKNNAKTPAKPSASTEATEPIVTRRGREIDATAAAARPRRAPTTPATAPTNATVKSTLTPICDRRAHYAINANMRLEPETSKTTTTTGKKRGRPSKADLAARQEEEAAEPPKKRGRPAKANATAPKPAKSSTAAAQPEPAKKRGRPAKKVKATETADAEAAEDEEEDPIEDAPEGVQPPKKRGRPSKQPAPAKEAAATQPPAKKRGRPSTKVATEPEENPAAIDTPARRKRGSGPTGGQTTKIATDAADAADQLEDELIDEAQKSAKKGKKSATAPDEDEDAQYDGKNYWVMKAEQIDRMETLKSGREFNTKFTIDDLKEANAPEPWEGVRNMVARNNMRAMKKGDLAFFYASQGKGKLQPGITGIVEVVREHEPDFTVSDEDSIGFVEPEKRAKENQWSLVHVEYRKKLTKPVSLKELQKFSTGTGVLSDMQLLKQSRLSVARVSEKEWDFIVNNLIEGYEEDGADAPASNAADGQQSGAGDSTVNGNQTVAGADAGEDEAPLPTNAFGGLPTIGAVNSMDDLLPTSGTALPPTTNATSRPTSRAGGSKRGSRQNSVAPIVQTAEAAASTIKSGLDTVVQALAPESIRPVSRGSQRPTSRSVSREPSLKPGSRGGSLEPGARPISRGRSKTPQASLMASLMEE